MVPLSLLKGWQKVRKPDSCVRTRQVDLFPHPFVPQRNNWDLSSCLATFRFIAQSQKRAVRYENVELSTAALVMVGRERSANRPPHSFCRVYVL